MTKVSYDLLPIFFDYIFIIDQKTYRYNYSFPIDRSEERKCKKVKQNKI